MANVSIPKVLLGIVYTLVPLLLWFVPSISEQLPEEWMVSAIVGVIVLIGLIFVMTQGNKPVRIIAIILLVLAAVYAGYMEYPDVVDDFAVVDDNYAAESGAFYSTEDTAFQVKQQVIIAHVVTALPTFADAAWLTTLLMILVLGCIGMKEVFSYAAIPSTHTSRALDSNAEITDADIETSAASVRPTAEQRAEALAKQKVAHAQNTIRQQNASQAQDQSTMQSIDGINIATSQGEPIIKVAEPQANSSTGSPFSFTSAENQPAPNATPAPEPVIKTPEASAMSPTSTMDSKFSKRGTDEAPVTSDGKVNIKIDLEQDPTITVENATVYKSADGQTSYYKDSQTSNPFDELKREAAEAGIKHEEQAYNPSGFYTQTTQTAQPEQTAAIPQFTSPFEQKTAPAPEPAPVQPEPVPVQPTPVAPAQPAPTPVAPEPSPAPTPAPAQTTSAEPNPFAAMGSPFAKKTNPAPAPAHVQPEPVAQTPTVEPAQTATSDTTQAAPKVVLPQPEPEPAKAEPAKTEPAKTTLPAKPEKPKMSEEEKQRIKELNKQVADLKTLYNQGMITQDEYIAQRTEILRKMYNNDK